MQRIDYSSWQVTRERKIRESSPLKSRYICEGKLTLCTFESRRNPSVIWMAIYFERLVSRRCLNFSGLLRVKLPWTRNSSLTVLSLKTFNKWSSLLTFNGGWTRPRPVFPCKGLRRPSASFTSVSGGSVSSKAV